MIAEVPLAAADEVVEVLEVVVVDALVEVAIVDDVVWVVVVAAAVVVAVPATHCE